MKSNNPKSNHTIDNAVISIFLKSRKNYGTRKIKVMLAQQNILLSRIKISKIMQRYNLISNYTKLKYKHQSNKNAIYKYHNLLNQEFNNYKLHEVVVSDLTQVAINSKWYYVCFLIDLFNREVIGYDVSSHKDAKLVENTFKKLSFSLDNIKIFHTDQGSEFNNNIIYNLLAKNNVAKSYSKPGRPYDNAVSESTYKILKTELIKNRKFKNIEQFKLELFDYVNWYNNVRIHSKLNYLTPIEYKNLYST
ncbi:Integrase core domain [Spiroplasma poulsonii]|uniref:Integrase core domain n=1 Tax=Spiroplasma poulsonii TaxID=2138 RepID=A0A2P6FCU6_9MOLU|nr:Integrase core domain [Spiroplasma poulsonii]PQM31266.1 Integrase core domain [Spiroplasma poulsonii]PWF99046.1 Integrase core domain protein [Spiroplasma poulsonii]